jgi:hypothetical protein
MESALTTRAQALFFSAMCRNDPYFELLQAAYEVLGWPILAGDDASTVILQIPDESIGSVWYDELLNDRHIRPEMFANFQDVMHKVYNPKGESIQLIPGENERYPIQICLTVRVYGAAVSQVIFHVPKPEISAEERTVLESLLQALTAECRKSRWDESPPLKRRQHQLRLLLEGGREPDILKHHAKGLRSVLGEDYVLVVSLLEEDKRKENFIPYYTEQIGKRVPDTVSIPYGDNIVTLCGGIRESRPPQLEALWELARTCSVVTGAAPRFSGSLTQLNTLYQQALLTARLGRRIRPQEFIFDFDSLAPLQVFLPALQEFQAKTFLSPKITAVMDYDRANGTEYLKTMLAYLVTGRNNRESIRLLSVHQNTLLYRLTKIRDLFGIDFIDGKLSLTLLCNMLLLEVAQPDLLPLYKLDSFEEEAED